MTVRTHTPPISGHDELFANVRDHDFEELWTSPTGDLLPISVDELQAYIGEPTDVYEDSDMVRHRVLIMTL